MITPITIKIPTAADSHATLFSYAITRLPAASAVNGLRAQNTGAVNINLMARQHNDYQEALRLAGAFVWSYPLYLSALMPSLLRIQLFVCPVWQ